MFSYIASRRLPAKPVDASAAHCRPERPAAGRWPPREGEQADDDGVHIALFKWPRSMMNAMMVGNRMSMTASSAANVGVGKRVCIKQMGSKLLYIYFELADKLFGANNFYTKQFKVNVLSKGSEKVHLYSLGRNQPSPSRNAVPPGLWHYRKHLFARGSPTRETGEREPD